MLGDLIYEGKGRIIGTRVLNPKETKIEYRLIEEGKFNDINVIITSTFWTVPTATDRIYGEAEAIITTKNGEETASYTGRGKGHLIKQGITIFRATNFYKTSSNRKLSFLNNLIGVVEAEAHQNKHFGKVWEWK